MGERVVRNDEVSGSIPLSSTTLFRVVVPARDSAPWIGLFADAYHALGLRPLYLYDTRSVDGTLAALQRKGAEIVPVTPQHDRVEAMLAITRQVVPNEWVVRLDDDELPSAALVAWLQQALAGVEAPCLALSRRDAWLLDGRLHYSRLEDYYFHPQDPTYLDPQWRAFRPRQVGFTDRIHSPGFDASQAGTVPASAFFVHFDWIIRSLAQRRAKLAGYERQSPGAGQGGFARFYLPEMHQAGDSRWTPFETAEFDGLARQLAINAAAAVPPAATAR